MKELSIEQKAKRYDEAVKYGQNLINERCKEGTDGSFHRADLQKMFPELKESEDESIRQFLIQEVTETSVEIMSYRNMNKKDVLAWLEKQGEKSEVKYVYTKFRIGDVIVEIKPNGYCQPVTVKYVGEGAYSCESYDGKRYLSFPIIRQDEFKLVEQKPALSEEDERFADKIVCVMKSSANGFPQDEAFVDEVDKWLKNKLKSLKERYAWKPSDEQMQVLSDAGNSFRPFEEGHKVL